MGYNLSFDDDLIFYPNIQLGIRNLSTTLEASVEIESAGDLSGREIYSINTIEYSINIPIKIMFNNSIGMGFNYAINGPDFYISKNGEEVSGEIDNSFNIFLSYTP